jgi:hypothetical protein
MILEDEVAIPAAPKDAVAVVFICNLRGSGCLYPQMQSRPLVCRSAVPCKPAKEKTKPRHRRCVLRRNLVSEWATHHSETIEMAEVYEGKSLAGIGWKFCAVSRS